MFWTFVGRILLARWLIVALVTLCSLAGGAYVAATAERQYDASARVMLLVYKPDPITGRTIGKKSIDPYLQTQLNLVRDFQVVGPAVEALGWMEDPEILDAYAARPPGDQRPLVVWLAQALIENLRADLVDNSNIVEITFRGRSPEAAELVVSAVRDAYIAAAINERRMAAAGEAEYQAQRSERLRSELAMLERQKRAMEAATGIVLGADGEDVDTRRLQALSAPPKAAGFQDFIQTGPGASANNLTLIDAELTQASTVLGPNHPRIAELRAMRSLVAASAAREQDMAAQVSSVVLGRERLKQAEFEAQRSKVLNQRQDRLRLRLLQDQIRFKNTALEASTKQLAYLRTLSTATESGLASVGKIESSPKPAFPNVPLILGGTAGIGCFAGIVLALLVEMFNLRVRSIGGLQIATHGRVLGSVPAVAASAPARGRRRLRLRKLKPVPA